jgi:regulator of sigma E protease
MLLTILKPILIILGVIVIFNLMIIVHELGHFLAARWRGLVIEKFGIWFGKPLWKKTINGVEYSLGCIPAGGFVALPQLAPMEVMEGKVETPREQLPPISALDKIIVAFAGPLFSFLLAFVFALIVWQAGKPERETETTQVIGYVEEGSPAEEAGVKEGDKILRVDGHEVTRFGGMGSDSVTWRIIRSEGDSVELLVERQVNGETKTEKLYPKPRVPTKTNWWNRKGLRMIGVGPAISAVVAEVTPETPAGRAGLQPGDVITAVNDQKLIGPGDIYEFAAKQPETPLTLTVQRTDGTVAKLPFDPTGVKVSSVTKGSPAEQAGLKAGDIILTMDGKKVPVAASVIDYVGTRGSQPIALQLQRGAESLALTVTPQVPAVTPDPAKKPMMGAVLDDNDGLRFQPMGKYRVVHPGPMEQIRAGVMSIVNTLDAVLSRKSSVSVQHMGGPVMMMNAYYTILSGPEGIRMALWFSVVLNVNLALLNLLPIPVLDGGHITLALIESIRRKPVNVRILEFVQTACALTIIGFMVFIAFFDVQDLPFVGGGRTPEVRFEQAAPTAKP